MMRSGTKQRLESNFQQEVIKYLDEVGAYVLKTHVSSYQKQGEPDITCCYKGRYIAFELKRSPREQPTELQKYKMKCIRNAGGIAARVDNLNQIKEVLYEVSRIQ